jgi:hypothetical protein
MPAASNARAASWKAAASERPLVDFLLVDFSSVNSLWIEDVG